MALEDPNNIEKTPPVVAQEPAVETERGAIKKKIEIPGVGEIEYTEKRVMFPEKIVQETGGVKGYIRKMVSWEELLRFWGIDESEWEKIKAGQIYRSREELEEENKEWLTEARSDLLHSKEALDEHPRRSSLEKFRNSEGISSIIRLMTKHEFIDQTLNHIVYGHKSSLAHNSSCKDLTRECLLEEFKVSGSFEVYNIESDKLLSEEEKKIILNQDKKVRNAYFQSSDGMNLTNPGSLWKGYNFQNSRNANSPWLNNILLGLKLNTRNNVLRKYCERALEIMLRQKINTENNYHDGEYRRQAELTMNALLYAGPRRSKQVVRGYQDQGEHPRIPIVMNHPDIPELRWCHADYAAIPTKNGYNIIEMIT